jgi:hypothetical protein
MAVNIDKYVVQSISHWPAGMKYVYCLGKYQGIVEIHELCSNMIVHFIQFSNKI